MIFRGWFEVEWGKADIVMSGIGVKDAVMAALAAEAQQAGKMYRIGYMSPNINPAFRQGLSELGYVEGFPFMLRP